jgi:phage baseplate assembly protein W
MDVDFPLHFDARGRTASAGPEDHLRELIELTLFTEPGERVNRPDFGCGLKQLIFAATSPELADALKFAVQAALQRWLGQRAVVRSVQASSVESTLSLSIHYVVGGSGNPATHTVTRSV